VKNAEPADIIDTDYLDSWFVGNRENIQEFHREYSRKVIIAPKFIRMLLLKEQNLDKVRQVLKFQKLEKFVRLPDNAYPDLVKVFLTNLWYDEDAIYSQVKGVDMCINEEVWLVVAGLHYAGISVGRSHVTELEGLKKPQLFQNMPEKSTN